MKNFFYTLFGGLLATVSGVLIAYGGSTVWNTVLAIVRDSGGGSPIAAVAHAVIPRPTDGTLISGFKRVINYTYTAAEEEDLINAAALTLPFGADGRISAAAYLVKNLTLGDVTIEHNSNRVVPIASVTKLVTATVARKLIDDDEQVTITREIMSTYGNTAGFRTGEVMTAGDLLYPLLMVSSNDAAEALARDFGRADFIREMNSFVQSIGAKRTHFEDPSGLSPRNVSTAEDVAIILDWLRKNDPKVIDITSIKNKTIGKHSWTNPTHFLSWTYYVGGKNGYTPEADRTAGSLFSLGKNKNIYAVVVLGSSSRDADMMKLLEKVR